MSNFCMHCGTMLSEDEKFCPNCGAKVEAKQEVKSEAVEPSTIIDNNQANQNNLNNNVNQAAATQKTNGLAIASMVCGIVGVFIANLWLGIIALSLGIVAKNKLKIFPEQKGKGMATAGIVLGIVDLGLAVLGFIIAIATINLF